MAYRLNEHMRVRLCGTAWEPTVAEEVSRFHTDAYIRFLQQLEANAALVADEVTSYVLNQSVCSARWHGSTL